MNHDNQSATEDSQSSESENVDVKTPITITPSDAANHEARRVQVLQDHTVASDAVNLANVDHIQTVVSVPQPTTSYDYYPGLCPICGDKISGKPSLMFSL